MAPSGMRFDGARPRCHMRSRCVKHIDLALQGGGAHTSGRGPMAPDPHDLNRCDTMAAEVVLNGCAGWRLLTFTVPGSKVQKGVDRCHRARPALVKAPAPTRHRHAMDPARRRRYDGSSAAHLDDEGDGHVSRSGAGK
jgi:hypothetical protein